MSVPSFHASAGDYCLVSVGRAQFVALADRDGGCPAGFMEVALGGRGDGGHILRMWGDGGGSVGQETPFYPGVTQWLGAGGPRSVGACFSMHVYTCLQCGACALCRLAQL